MVDLMVEFGYDTIEEISVKCDTIEFVSVMKFLISLIHFVCIYGSIEDNNLKNRCRS